MPRMLAAFTLAASLAASLAGASASAEQRFARPPVATSPSERRIVVDRDTVRAKLLDARAANLARFRAYQAKGVFPSNVYDRRITNVWRDDAGNFCAAATMIRLSGQTALADQVAATNNYTRLADITDGPLMYWMLTSGLTQGEIAAIQEPMMPVFDEPEPGEPAVVNAGLRAAEDRRLIAKYKLVDAQIVKNQKASLEVAVDRLMANPRLAHAFVTR
ncbi:MAG: hypothetical protein KIT31_01835 [Deltaproteobacteria bacterium]|nr:hypothetical protein [Deltaproteobacteria bacterium]